LIALASLTSSEAAARVGMLRGLAPVFPAPHSLATRPGAVRLTSTVMIVAPKTADPEALTVVRRMLASTDATVRITRRPPVASRGRLTVILGRGRDYEQPLHVKDSSGLPPGGYVLASGTARGAPVIVLDGVDAAGELYAAQTLSQLLANRLVWPAFAIRDWPSFGSRGIVEGFYGTPWSPAERLSMLDFLARHKLNLYMYLPKDDPYVRGSWRTPLPAEQLESFRSSAARAMRDHIEFNYGISPGDSICYSSPSDVAALIAKYTSLSSVDIRSFTLAFDDIDATRAPCPADVAKYGSGPTALARAQAAVVNAVAAALNTMTAAPLTLVPTEYSGLAGTPYKRTLASLVDSGVTVQWTGPYGVSMSVSASETAAARRLYAHPLLIWDNYFVNDLLPGYLVLGAYAGRDRAIAKSADGIVIDPMAQPEASRLGLFTAADFEWNAGAYNAARSWTGSIGEFAGGDQVGVSALRTFAGANYGSPADVTQSPALASAMAAFWKSWDAGDASAASQLGPELERLRDAPATIRARVRNASFLSEASPWLDATQLWGAASVAALDLMVARKNGDADRAASDEATARAARSQATLMNVPGTSPPASISVAGGALSEFVHYALRGYGP
jgi:hyaluronoglucosaminidase